MQVVRPFSELQRNNRKLYTQEREILLIKEKNLFYLMFSLKVRTNL